MSKRTVWVVESAVTALVILGLVYAANFRYARPLVDPAPPTPDYALQATIACVGIAAVLIVAGVLTVVLTRTPRPRPSSAVGVAAIIAATGIAIVVIAFGAAAR